MNSDSRITARKLVCPGCGRLIDLNYGKSNYPVTYCSKACKQRAYRGRKKTEQK